MAEYTITEEWRLVEDWPEYEVSNLGRVRRAVAITRGRGGQTIPAGFILKQHYIRAGRYPSVRLYKSGRGTHMPVYRIVCRAFNGPMPTPRHEVAHNDGVCTNSAAYNLRWATRAENMADRDKHGKTIRGSRHVMAKLSEDDIPKIRHMIDSGMTYADIGRLFGVKKSTIQSVKEGRSWGWLEHDHPPALPGT